MKTATKDHKEFRRACVDVFEKGIYFQLPHSPSWNSLIVEESGADKSLSLGYDIEE